MGGGGQGVCLWVTVYTRTLREVVCVCVLTLGLYHIMQLAERGGSIIWDDFMDCNCLLKY